MPDRSVEQIEEHAASAVDEMKADAAKRRQERNAAFDNLRAEADMHTDEAVCTALKALAALYEVSLAAQGRPFAETPLSLGGPAQ